MTRVYYHDDPVEEPLHSESKFLPYVKLVGLLIVAYFFIQTTYAANIGLGGGSNEFGQGVMQTTACSGNTALSIAPISKFVNSSGAGAYYLQGVTVSNIPSSCNGYDFTINAYGVSGNATLPLFNASSTDAVIYQNAGAYSEGYGSTGMTVTSGSGTFTVTFTNPVASTISVGRVTIQSGNHTPWAVVGQTGPGGGKVFYYSAGGFNCGPTMSDTCHWLEAAPVTWNGGSSDPDLPWSNVSESATSVSGLVSSIGAGYKNSLLIQSRNGTYNSSTNKYGAGAALAYRGGGLSDWYLGSLPEIIEMKNQQNLIGGLTNYMYMSSNQYDASHYIAYYFPWSQQFFPAKSTSPGEDRGVRPIRSF